MTRTNHQMILLLATYLGAACAFVSKEPLSFSTFPTTVPNNFRSVNTQSTIAIGSSASDIDPELLADYVEEFDPELLREYIAEKEEYERYKDKRSFREYLSSSGVFSGESPDAVERIVFDCISNVEEYSKGETVYAKGDSPKALFFVKSGEFECGFPDELGGPRIFKEGEYFGGVAALTGRAPFGAKAVGKGENAVWRVSESSYKGACVDLRTNKQMMEKILSGTGNTAPYVEQALKLVEIKNSVNSTYIFNGTLSDETANLAAASMELKEFKQGDVVYEQGQDSKSLYLIKSGEFDLYDGTTKKKTLKSVKKRSRFFGEIGSLIDAPRMYTVKVHSDKAEVWKIPPAAVEHLKEDMDQSQFLSMIMYKYQDEPFLKKWIKLIKNEPKLIYSFLKTKSDPKKKKVSRHSSISMLACGMCLLAMVPHLSFKWTNNFIQFLKLSVEAPSHYMQLNVSNTMLTAVMLMGQLRFKSRPKTYDPRKLDVLRPRRLLFNTLSTGMMMNYFAGMSNLMGTHSKNIIDAWSWPGRFLLVGSMVGSVYGMTILYYDIIVGAKAGREKNPFYESRWRGLVSTSLYNLSMFAQFALMIPMFESREKFLGTTGNLLAQCGLTPGVLTMAKFLNIFYLSMGALYGTYQHEMKKPGGTIVETLKKENLWDKLSKQEKAEKEVQKKGEVVWFWNKVLAATAVFLLTDLYHFIFDFLRGAHIGTPEFVQMRGILGGILNRYKLHYLWFGPLVAACIRGFFVSSRVKRYDPKPKSAN